MKCVDIFAWKINSQVSLDETISDLDMFTVIE